MLRPSYSELMGILNDSNDVDSEITSRYTIVIAAAKRARQIIDGAIPMCQTSTDKSVSIAVEEMYQGKLKISASISPSDDTSYKGHYSNIKEVDNLDEVL